MSRQPGGEEIAAGCLLITLALAMQVAIFAGAIWVAVWLLRALGVLPA